MNASEQIMQAIELASDQARKAQKNWDASTKRVKELARKNIDILGGTASKQLVEIAATLRKANDDLYATKQMCVQMLDQQCRPLLEQNPSAESVKELAEYIKLLNDESEITANVTGSLNGTSLGNVANAQYIASIENRMIEKFWQSTYDAMPEAIAEKEAKRNREADARGKAIKDQEVYQAALKQWEAKSKTAEDKRSEEYEKQMKIIREQLESAKERIFNETKTRWESVINEQTKLKEETLAAFNALGFFKFSEKMMMKKKIEEASTQIAHATEKLQEVNEQHHHDMETIQKELEKKGRAIREDLEKKIPIPCKPVRPKSLKIIDPTIHYQEAISESLLWGASYSAKEILEEVSEVSALPFHKIVPILHRMVEYGDLGTVVDHGKVRYVLKDSDY